MTDGLAYFAAFALAVVFGYSAIAKFRDAHPTRRALTKAGIPGSSVIAKLLPAFEVVIAALLLVRPAVGAFAALALLSVFTGFIGFLIARKIDVSCGCFGANATKSVSVVDLVRNAFLVALAGIATSVARPTSFALEEVIATTTALAIGAVVLAALGTRQQLGQLFDNRLPGGL